MPYYPQYYPPQYQQPMMQQAPVQQPQTTQPMVQQQPQIQNSFVSIQSEDMVAMYPVAPGHCVTFKVDGKPIMYEKSMGFSQFEAPRIKRYRVVEEDAPVEPPKSPDKPEIDLEGINVSIDKIKGEIGQIWGEIEALKKPASVKKKKEGADDEKES